MPTPAEQKALAFLGIVVLLGGAVRVLGAGAPPGPLPQERQALARQATAVDSAAAAARSAKSSRSRRAPKVKAARPGAEPIVVGGLTTVPPYAGYGNGYSPPGPRIDVGAAPSPPTGLASSLRRAGSARVDLDRASEQEITSLPRVGPALARRIVASRDSFGAFGSLEGLRRVKGIGAATAERLGPLVTFSGHASSRP